MKTLYDKQVEEIMRNGEFLCPPIFKEGINRYQMTCDDCPEHIRKLCREASQKKSGFMKNPCLICEKTTCDMALGYGCEELAEYQKNS